MYMYRSPVNILEYQVLSVGAYEITDRGNSPSTRVSHAAHVLLWNVPQDITRQRPIGDARERSVNPQTAGKTAVGGQHRGRREDWGGTNAATRIVRSNHWALTADVQHVE